MCKPKRIRRIHCECGCGKYVKPEKRFICGHNSRGKTHPMLGRKHSTESKEKMSESSSGKNNHWYGRHHSEETKRKISSALSGKHFSVEHKEKLSKTAKGRKHTKETLKKMSIAQSGQNNPNYGRRLSDKAKERISNANFGRVPSDETRALWSSQRTGCGNPNWRGGISAEPYCEIFSNKEFTEMILERDNYECQNPLCRKNSINMRRHHINYDKKDCVLQNLITVCVSCNSRANWNKEFWQKHYEEIMKRKIF